MVSPTAIKQALIDCDLLISDYSGIQADYLALKKPMIHFPFDLSDYLKVRKLYLNYKDFAFGPVVNTVDEMVECLVSQEYLKEVYVKKADSWRQKYFVRETVGYAQDSYETIQKLLLEKA